MKLEFPCTKCGACCKSVRLSELTQHFDRGDGSCKHFDEEENNCQIYDSRPEICNISTIYKNKYETLIDWKTFVTLNQISCNELHKQQNLISKNIAA